MVSGLPQRFHQFPEKFHGGLAVSLLRDKGLQHLTFLVDGAPKVMAFAVDLYEHLIEAPPPNRKRTLSIHPLLADLGGEDRTEPVPPEPDRLMANLDPSLVQKILDIA